MPLVLIALLLLAVYAPQFWVRRVLRRHAVESPDLPGTGAELARHLIVRFDLGTIGVEPTDAGRDRFDPSGPTVYLGPAHFNGRSLAAVAVAAHEVGHAMQFVRAEPVFRLRQRWVPLAALLQRLGIGLLVAAPVVGGLAHVPALALALAAAGIGLQLGGALLFLIVLPEEWDASFNKALPILTHGAYISAAQVPAVRQVLRAAALTYFAGALASLVNIAQWARVLVR